MIGRDVDWKTRNIFPDSKVHGANMGPTWVLSAPDDSDSDSDNVYSTKIDTDTISDLQKT